MLATRSDFSIGESILTVERVVELAKSVGQTAVALTDTMSVTALLDFAKAAKKAGIKPIMGCRLRFVDDVTWRKTKTSKKTPPSFYLTYYVLSEKGLQALFRLLSLANSDSHFYYFPKLAFQDLFDALATLSKDDVAIASSDALSVLHYADAEMILAKIGAAIGAENTFLTLTPVNTPYFDTMNAKAIALLKMGGCRPLVTRPVFYGEGEADQLDVMAAVTAKEPLSSVWHTEPVNRDFHPLTEEAMEKEIYAAQERLRARGVSGFGVAFHDGRVMANRLVDNVTYEWAKAPASLPKMAPDEFAAVTELCKQGWRDRFTTTVFGHKPAPADLVSIYLPRLKYELGVLKTLNFSGYFLLVDEVVRFAKNAGIRVGPGRGSVGGSLVAYLMGITDVDPIRFGLLFERFINPDRIDLPDADLDFMSERRHEIIAHLMGKYGAAHVAGVSNFMALGSASTIRDVGRVFELDEGDTRCSMLAPKEHGMIVKLADCAVQVAEINAFRLKHPFVWKTCLKLEGVQRTLGKHAAGVIVSDCPLTDRAVVERRSGDAVVNWDKRMVEDQGLIKMDILGVSTLDLIEMTINYIRGRHKIDIDILKVPLDDEKVLDNFAKAKTVGVFQFGSGGMKRLLRELGRDGTITFDDVTAATALYRPGPMDSGMMDNYWKRKQGLESVEIDHPNIADAVAPTFGVMVYQEQVMKASVDVAGYSLPDADKLRKIMGKKLPEEMKKEREKFVNGCVAKSGMTDYEATNLFEKIEKFAAYGFNKSHSVAYTLISYQCMWLKTYYPVEFIASALSLMKDEELPALLQDANHLGVEVLLPDINLSSDKFEILNDHQIMIPFNRIKGLTSKTAGAIMEARKAGPFTSKEDLVARVNKSICNVAKIEALNKIGALVSVEPGSVPQDDDSRIRDQKELIPGLINSFVPIARVMNLDKFHKAKVQAIVHEYLRDQEDDQASVKPTIGASARFMVITDAASKGEEEIKKVSYGKSFGAFQEALACTGLSRADIYWTTLVKRQKEAKQVTPREVSIYSPYLLREIEATKPPVVVLCGSTVVRQFVKDFKGKASDAAGQVIYDKVSDTNYVIGFSPGEIYFNPEKQNDLNRVFEIASLLTAH